MGLPLIILGATALTGTAYAVNRAMTKATPSTPPSVTQPISTNSITLTPLSLFVYGVGGFTLFWFANKSGFLSKIGV